MMERMSTTSRTQKKFVHGFKNVHCGDLKLPLRARRWQIGCNHEQELFDGGLL
jgi:hypothetical protein